MAIYHLSVKAVSRSAGRSATAAAAYRAGCEIIDERTGEIHDYRRKAGVESADIVLPAGVAAEWATDRAKLWSAAELAEKRKDACVAREVEVALPAELSPKERRALALDFAQRMADREGCAVDVSIHAPGKEGDNRNHHAHILRTTRKVEAEGLGAKLDTEKSGRSRSADLEAIRREWAEVSNQHLARAGLSVRIDHRSLEEQGVDREPTRHLGPTATAIERRGEASQKRLDWQAEASERLARASEAGELERQLDQSILDLSGDLEAAKRERDQLNASALKLAATRERLDARLPEFGNRIAERAAKRKAEKEAADRAELEARKRAEAEAKQRKADELEKLKKLELANYAKKLGVEVAREGLRVSGKVEDVQRGPSGRSYAVVSLGRGQAVATPCPAELKAGDTIRGEIKENGLHCRVEKERSQGYDMDL